VESVEPQPDGSLELQLTDGGHLCADLLVVGIGAVPDTGWLEGSGLTLDSGAVCDASLQAAPGVFAIGDIAVWPNGLFGQTMRMEHWTNASEQARHVARNLLEETDAPFHGSNYFWSDQYGGRIQFAGVATGEPTVLLEGAEEAPFLAR
jgi:NADPH-dependent 2,4-dienoyl-CoA reductase/sulfur reductase-like enzyme